MSIVSIFAGCGGMDTGAKEAGHTITRAYEIDPVACAAYDQFVDHRIEQSDLCRLDPRSFPDCDGIIGGPPCQEFSFAATGLNAGADGEKNRWPEAVAAIAAKRPRWFCFENVKHLVYSRKHRVYFLKLIDEFKALGYRVDYRVLNAADYGVPQTRERVFLVGRRDGGAWRWPEPTYSACQSGLFTSRWVSCGEALSEWITETPEPSKLPNWIMSKYSDHPFPQSGYFSAQNAGHKKQHRDIDQPSFTVVASRHNRVRVMVDRTVYLVDARALAILQGLPTGITEVRLIGNAVPPLLARAVLSGIEVA